MPDAREELVRWPALVRGLPPDEVGTGAEEHDHGAVAFGSGAHAALDPPAVRAASDERGRRRGEALDAARTQPSGLAPAGDVRTRSPRHRGPRELGLGGG